MNGFDISTISGIYVGSTPYSAIYKGSTLVWSAIDYSKEYLTIESLEDNNEIHIINYWGSTTYDPLDPYSIRVTLSVSYDKQTWTNIGTWKNSDFMLAIMNRGDKLYIKGNTHTGGRAQCDNSSNSLIFYYNYISPTKTYNLSGNIMSLLYGDNFENQTILTDNYCFYQLFHNNTSLIDASNLVLPATTLTNYCYYYMFYGCTSLTTAPSILPATTLADYCYQYMFQGCTSLTTAPELPATTLADNCYGYMFYGCTSLTTAPELPATTLANACYNYMFAYTNTLPDCTNIDFTSSTVVSSGGLKGLFSFTKVTDNDLNNILPKNSNNKYCLPVTTLSTYCYSSMFRGCTSLTTTPVLSATTLGQYCYSNMFYGCTSLTSISQISASTLANNCYYCMFYGCTSLTTIPSNLLPVTTLANNCYYYMFNGCTSLTTVPSNLLPATTLTDSCYYGMFYGCTSLTTAPTLSSTSLSSSCYRYMFYGCTSLTTAPELPATTLANYCYAQMFQGCTSLTTTPELPATTLVSNCYRYMFNGCTNLTYVKALFTTDITSSPSSYTFYWLQNVAASGTFIKSDSATWSVTGDNGVPNGWTVKIDGAPADNASMKLYYNACVGSLREFTSVSTGTNLTVGSDTSKWYYGNNKYVSFNRSNSRYATCNVKLSLVITGFSQFKCALSGSNNARIGLGVLNYNRTVNSGDIYSSNSNITIAVGYSELSEYTYTGLDPDTKYLISVYLYAYGNCSPILVVPSSYPSFTLTDSGFSSSSDYTDIFG